MSLFFYILKLFHFLLRREILTGNITLKKSDFLFPASLLNILGTALGISINVRSSCWSDHWELLENHFLWNSIDHDKIPPSVNLVLATRRKDIITVDTVVLASEHLTY